MLRFTHLSSRIILALLGTFLLSGCAGSMTGSSANFGKPAQADNSRLIGLPSGDGESVVVVQESKKGASADGDR
jgi:hypothetical protein